MAEQGGDDGPITKVEAPPDIDWATALGAIIRSVDQFGARLHEAAGRTGTGATHAQTEPYIPAPEMRPLTEEGFAFLRGAAGFFAILFGFGMVVCPFIWAFSGFQGFVATLEKHKEIVAWIVTIKATLVVSCVGSGFGMLRLGIGLSRPLAHVLHVEILEALGGPDKRKEIAASPMPDVVKLVQSVRSEAGKLTGAVQPPEAGGPPKSP